MANWTGKRVVILGAARQGLALARYLSSQGAKVTLNDMRTADQLEAARRSTAGMNIEWVVGGHPLHLLNDTDLIAISGGIPLTNSLVVEAVRRGIPLTNDTQIFLETVPCRTIGITGSAGKTTTTTLVGRIAKAGLSGKFREVWIGGNIGDPLINYVDDMTSDDLAILEISSFQLEQMTLSPNIAAVLNITPNHLDRHGTLEAYSAAKERILDFQSAEDKAILNRDDPGSWALAKKVKGSLLSFGFTPLSRDGDGTFVQGTDFYVRTRGREEKLPVADAIELRGEHNRLNVMAACAISYSAGFTSNDMRAGIEGFKGVAHRLEFVRDWHGSLWYNDSIATAPERTIAAINSFSSPLVVMLGGRDKNLPWDDLAKVIHKRVDHVILFGEAAPKIDSVLGPQISGQRPFTRPICKNLKEAIISASRATQPGYVVLFSPGGTSYDEFNDFEERGENFRKWVLELS
jgi:UDP-N-acetylmuramoylalanine--D-glutamate ligase